MKENEMETQIDDRSAVLDRDDDDESQAPAAPSAETPDSEAGMATAEYAVATVGAVGLAGLLIAILKSDMVRGLLESLVQRALTLI
jgi:hypothetical protein